MRLEGLIGIKMSKTRRQLADRFTAYFSELIRALLARGSDIRRKWPGENPEDTR
jgi:hypothetical protein